MTDSKISLKCGAPSREELTGYYNPKSKQNGKGHDASCPQEKLVNNMVRAQFIVPIQYNYN
ncbi:MAG TPA: hypothetical protein DHW70_01285 [Candidatus Atribacteria bacterium]|nr:hypothetical protein [Candidatus Atribacteria bacterium]